MVFFSTACEHMDHPDGVDPFADESARGAQANVLVDGTPDAIGMLRLLNAPSTTVAALDHDVELDSRAARALIGHRDGADALYGTPDDDVFDDVTEVYNVSWVGDATVARLVEYAGAHGWGPASDELLGIFEGVAFSVEEAEMTLSLVNTAPEYLLDEDVGLDARAVTSVIEARPISSMLQLAGLPHVGPAALGDLRAYTIRYLNQGQSDGSFVLTPNLADYYLEVMVSVLRDDREYFAELALVAHGADEVDRILVWIEVELEREIEARVGQVFPSEQDLLDELFGVLETLEERGRTLLLN